MNLNITKDKNKIVQEFITRTNSSIDLHPYIIDFKLTKLLY